MLYYTILITILIVISISYIIFDKRFSKTNRIFNKIYTNTYYSSQPYDTIINDIVHKAVFKRLLRYYTKRYDVQTEDNEKYYKETYVDGLYNLLSIESGTVILQMLMEIKLEIPKHIQKYYYSFHTYNEDNDPLLSHILDAINSGSEHVLAIFLLQAEYYKTQPIEDYRKIQIANNKTIDIITTEYRELIGMNIESSIYTDNEEE